MRCDGCFDRKPRHTCTAHVAQTPAVAQAAALHGVPFTVCRACGLLARRVTATLLHRHARPGPRCCSCSRLLPRRSKIDDGASLAAVHATLPPRACWSRPVVVALRRADAYVDAQFSCLYSTGHDYLFCGYRQPMRPACPIPGCAAVTHSTRALGPRRALRAATVAVAPPGSLQCHLLPCFVGSPSRYSSCCVVWELAGLVSALVSAAKHAEVQQAAPQPAFGAREAREADAAVGDAEGVCALACGAR